MSKLFWLLNRLIFPEYSSQQIICSHIQLFTRYLGNQFSCSANYFQAMQQIISRRRAKYFSPRKLIKPLGRLLLLFMIPKEKSRKHIKNIIDMYLIFNYWEKEVKSQNSPSLASSQHPIPLHVLPFPCHRIRRIRHAAVFLEVSGRSLAAQILWLSAQRQSTRKMAATNLAEALDAQDSDDTGRTSFQKNLHFQRRFRLKKEKKTFNCENLMRTS